MRKLSVLVLALLLALMLSGCDEIKSANNALLVCEGVYATVHRSCQEIYTNVDLPVQDRLEFRDQTLPALQAMEASLAAANVALQAYITAKDGDKEALLDAFRSLVGNADALIRAFNQFAQVFGRHIPLPPDLQTAFGLLD